MSCSVPSTANQEDQVQEAPCCVPFVIHPGIRTVNLMRNEFQCTGGEAMSANERTAVKAVAIGLNEDEEPQEAGQQHQRTYIARLIVRMQDALRQLGVDVDHDTTEYVCPDDDDDDRQAQNNNNNNVSKRGLEPNLSEQRFWDSIDEVDEDMPIWRRIEAMSILIHESMSISSRNYHSVQHVFDISRDLDDPIAVLSALFHDCVYYNIDGGLSELQAAKLHGVLSIRATRNSFIYAAAAAAAATTTTTTASDNTAVPQSLPPPVPAPAIPPKLQIDRVGAASDELLCMVLSVYGFEPGQEMSPTTGLNEFLSAVIAVRELEPLLPRPILAQIACCIEATIPFRPAEKGILRLYDNMILTNERFQLNMSEDELVKAVQRAALLSNEDVGNFGTLDRAWFLDNTWSLLPETNEALRHQYLYTVQEFQFAVFKMYGFFSFLKPTMIFQRFRGVPSDEEFEERTRNATRNMEVGRKYVGAKLLSISVLSAFAELTGGDAPISLFMGDLPSRHRVSRRLEDVLMQQPEISPLPPGPGRPEFDQDVYNLLALGRGRESSFDVRQSPLAAYFYASLGDDELQQVLTDIKVYPMTESTARALLSRMPRPALELVSLGMSKVALSRKEMIAQVLHDLDSCSLSGKDNPCFTELSSIDATDP